MGGGEDVQNSRSSGANGDARHDGFFGSTGSSCDIHVRPIASHPCAGWPRLRLYSRYDGADQLSLCGGPSAKRSDAEHLIQTIDGFTLGGAPVSAPGLNSSYGLYLELFGSGQPIAGAFTFSFLNVALKADVGYDDGTPSSTLAGLAFSNPAGTANDVTLATGTLISASLVFHPDTGVRNAHFTDTFVSSPGESGLINGRVRGKLISS